MWSPFTEAGSDNLALLHCSSLHACLAAYLNILRRDLNTMCIIINRGMWSYGRGPFRQRSDELGGFWSKPSIKSGDKNHKKVVNTCKVWWSARLNTSRVTKDRLEDRSSQWEAMKRSVELLTAMVVDAHRVRYQRQWTATFQHLIGVEKQNKNKFQN